MPGARPNVRSLLLLDYVGTVLLPYGDAQRVYYWEDYQLGDQAALDDIWPEQDRPVG